MPWTPTPGDDRDHLTDALEAMDSYWECEAQLAEINRGELNGSRADIERLEDDQALLLDRALASAATSIAVSLARIAQSLSTAEARPASASPRPPRAEPSARGRRGRRGRTGQTSPGEDHRHD